MTVSVKFTNEFFIVITDRSPFVVAERNIVHQLYSADCVAFVYFGSNPCKLCAGSYLINAVCIRSYFCKSFAVPHGSISFCKVYGNGLAADIGLGKSNTAVFRNIAVCGYGVCIFAGLCGKAAVRACFNRSTGSVHKSYNRTCGRTYKFNGDSRNIFAADGNIGHNISYMRSRNCAEVCSYAVVGENSVSAERRFGAHNIKVHITAGKLDVTIGSDLHSIFIGADKVVLTTGGFNKFNIIGGGVCDLVSLTEAGVINSGEFCNGLIESMENNADIVADIGNISAAGFVGNGIGYLRSSYHLIGGFAVCGELENIIALNKTESCKAAVCVFTDILPSLALIG